MDKKYDKIYASLYADNLQMYYPPYSTPFNIEHVVDIRDMKSRRNWINLHIILRESIDENGSMLREDAKTFLFINMSYMVILPILIAKDSDAIQAVEMGMPNDIKLLVNEADKQTEGKQLISAHEIINTLSKSWDRLKTMQLRVWGASSQQKGYENE